MFSLTIMSHVTKHHEKIGLLVFKGIQTPKAKQLSN